MTTPLRAALAWLVILVLAIGNGAFRQKILVVRLGERAGHVISTLLLSAVVVLATWLLWPLIRPAGPREAWMVGLVWLGLTLAFEFLAGHYLFGTPWEKLLADYNLLEGRIWVLVLLTTLLAPVMVHQLR